MTEKKVSAVLGIKVFENASISATMQLSPRITAKQLAMLNQQLDNYKAIINNKYSEMTRYLNQKQKDK